MLWLSVLALAWIIRSHTLAASSCLVHPSLKKNGSLVVELESSETSGFVFDMGVPSWYWMPDVFEWLFSTIFGKEGDRLLRSNPTWIHLMPGHLMAKKIQLDFPAIWNELKQCLKESTRCWSSVGYIFKAQSKYKYQVGDSWSGQKAKSFPFFRIYFLPRFTDGYGFDGFFPVDVKACAEVFSNRNNNNPFLIEFPVLFLGETADNIPALTVYELATSR